MEYASVRSTETSHFPFCNQISDYFCCLHFESGNQQVFVQDTEIYHWAPFFAGLRYYKQSTVENLRLCKFLVDKLRSFLAFARHILSGKHVFPAWHNRWELWIVQTLVLLIWELFDNPNSKFPQTCDDNNVFPEPANVTANGLQGSLNWCSHPLLFLPLLDAWEEW